MHFSPGQSPDLGDEGSSCNSVVLSDCDTLGTETQFTHEKLNHRSRCLVSSLPEKMLTH